MKNQDPRRMKRYYRVIKSCNECPFWYKCPHFDFVVGYTNFQFPKGCLLKDYTGKETEEHTFYVSDGGM